MARLAPDRGAIPARTPLRQRFRAAAPCPCSNRVQGLVSLLSDLKFNPTGGASAVLSDNERMAELIDPRPVFTIVMGCNGVGKSAWKRDNYDMLPDRYFDQDSIAGGIGDWNSPEARGRTREYVDAEVAKAIAERLDFGMESTYSGLPGPELVNRVIRAGYRVEGIYIGTEHPSINVERIRYRVFARTGHEVDPARIPTRWKYSLSNLRTTAEKFDQLRIFDNSSHDELRQPCLVEQCRLKRGEVVWTSKTQVAWCVEWMRRLSQRRERTLARKAALSRSGPDGGDRGFSR